MTQLRPDTRDDVPVPGRRRRRIAVGVAVVVVLALLATWLIAFSSVLGVGTVAVHGTHLLDSAQVRHAADLTDGTPLVRVDTAEVTRRVERLPEVASAQVSTSFPSTVDITVTERRPVGYLRTAGHDVLVDRTGFRYRTVGATPAGLPRLVVPGDAGSAAVRAQVAQVAASLPASLLARVGSIQALDRNAITLVLRHGKVVRWGSAARSDDKARVLAVLLDRKGTQIDVTDPDQPFTH